MRTYETVLYATDLDASAAWYADVLGFAQVSAVPGVLVALRVDAGSVLLLFDPARSAVEGRDVPSHGASGPGHVAFMVEPGTLDARADALRARGVAVERELTWPAGGRSLYVRDPAGNSVELVDGELWPPA